MPKNDVANTPYIYVSQVTASSLYEHCKICPKTEKLALYIRSVMDLFDPSVLHLPLDRKKIELFYPQLLTLRLQSSTLALPMLATLILSGELDLARDLIPKASKTQLNQTSHYGTALHCACLKNTVAISALLLSHHANPSLKSIDQETPLHLAVNKGNSNLVKLLIDRQADPSMQNKNGETPLHLAVLQQKVEMIETLIKSPRANLDIQNAYGNTPLHISSLLGNKKIVEILLKENADKDLLNITGELPIHHASHAGALDIVELLSEQNPICIDTEQDDGGFTPYLTAISEGFTSIEKRLPSFQSHEVFLRKAIAHIFDLEGVTQYGQLRPIKLEGFNGKGWVDLIKKIIQGAYEKGALPISENQFALILDLYSSFQSKPSVESVMARLERDQAILLPFGYKGHAATLLIAPETGKTFKYLNVSIINRGGHSKVPVESWTVANPELINHSMIKEILTIHLSKEFNYEIMRKKMIHDMKAFQIPSNKFLESVYSHLPPQTVGNCSWVSLITSLLPYMSSLFIRDTDWEGKILYAFDQIENYSKLFILNEWAKHNIGTIGPDYEIDPLIINSINKIPQNICDSACSPFLREEYLAMCKSLRPFFKK